MTRWFVRTVWINSAIIRNILSTPLSVSQLEEDAVSELSILPDSVARVQKRHLHRLSTLVPDAAAAAAAALGRSSLQSAGSGAAQRRSNSLLPGLQSPQLFLRKKCCGLRGKVENNS